jgi:hypothetical protein
MTKDHSYKGSSADWTSRPQGPVSKLSCFLGDPPPDPRFLASLGTLPLVELDHSLDWTSRSKRPVSKSGPRNHPYRPVSYEPRSSLPRPVDGTTRPYEGPHVLGPATGGRGGILPVPDQKPVYNNTTLSRVNLLLHEGGVVGPKPLGCPRPLWSCTRDSAPSEVRKRGSGVGSPRSYDDLLTGPSDLKQTRLGGTPSKMAS